MDNGTIELSEPIEEKTKGGEVKQVWREIRIRAPRFKDFLAIRQCMSMDGEDLKLTDPLGAAEILVTRLTNLPRHLVGEIHGQDMGQIMGLLAGFFDNFPESGSS